MGVGIMEIKATKPLPFLIPQYLFLYIFLLSLINILNIFLKIYL